MSGPTLPNAFDSNIYSLENLSMVSPGAGNNFTVQSEPRAQFEIIQLQLTLSTDATVLDRFVTLELQMFTTDYRMGVTITAIPASEIHRIVFATGITPYFNSTIFHHYVPIPSGIIMDDANTINILNLGRQAGDVLSDINLIAKIWPSR